jgi:hypothetical protein
MTQATEPSKVLIRVLDPKAPYQIQLTVRDSGAFENAMSDPRFQGKSEEQLLAALFAEFKTQIIEIERYNANNKCNDGPQGQPASQVFNEDGVMILQRRYCEGKLQDSASGEPAVLEYDGNRILRVKEHHNSGKIFESDKGEPSVTTYAPDGSLQCEERFEGNLYNDSESGQPAMVLYNRDGQPIFVEHFKAGQLHDGVTGEPAYKQFDESGRLAEGVRYKNGVEQGELNADELAAYNAALTKSLPESKRPGPKRSGPPFPGLKP